MTKTFSVFAILFLLASSVAAADLAVKKALTLEVAKEMAAAAEKYADSQGWNANVAIVDDGGNLIYFQRGDGVQMASVDISIAKARAAVGFKHPTKAMQDRAAAGEPHVAALPWAMPFEGGLPIDVDGALIGGIGISGMTSAQDGQIAKAAIDALPGILGQ